MCSPLWYTPNSHRRVHAHSSIHVALAHTHEHSAYIRCSSRTPCSVEYTQHIGPAPTRVTIAFTRRPTMAVLKCRKSQIGRPNMCASIRVTGDPKVGKLHCLRRRAIALPHSRLLGPSDFVGLKSCQWPGPRFGFFNLKFPSRRSSRSSSALLGGAARLSVACMPPP